MTDIAHFPRPGQNYPYVPVFSDIVSMKDHRMALGKFKFFKYGSEKVEDGDPVNLGGGEL